jgi:succinylglutamate desuccinylase
MSNSTTETEAPVSRRLGTFEGAEPGPTIIATAAVHGNEYAGVVALQDFFRTLDTFQPDAFRGRLVGLVGNLGAFTGPDPEVRYRSADLNRLATPANAAQVRRTPASALQDEMLELKELLAEIEDEVARATGPIIHLDLHTVSSPSPPFCGVIDSQPARELATKMPIPVIMGIDRHLSGLLVDLTAKKYGMTSFVVEGGQHDDPESAIRHEAALRIVLNATGALPAGTLPWDRDAVGVLSAAAGEQLYRIFEIVSHQTIDADDFRMREGIESFTPVVGGETIVADVNGRPVRAAGTGLLFLPNRQKHPRQGDDAYFLVREVS